MLNIYIYPKLGKKSGIFLDNISFDRQKFSKAKVIFLHASVFAKNYLCITQFTSKWTMIVCQYTERFGNFGLTYMKCSQGLNLHHKICFRQTFFFSSASCFDLEGFFSPAFIMPTEKDFNLLCEIVCMK